MKYCQLFIQLYVIYPTYLSFGILFPSSALITPTFLPNLFCVTIFFYMFLIAILGENSMISHCRCQSVKFYFTGLSPILINSPIPNFLFCSVPLHSASSTYTILCIYSCLLMVYWYILAKSCSNGST